MEPADSEGGFTRKRRAPTLQQSQTMGDNPDNPVPPLNGLPNAPPQHSLLPQQPPGTSPAPESPSRSNLRQSQPAPKKPSDVEIDVASF
jgi:hypothetical protein